MQRSYKSWELFPWFLLLISELTLPDYQFFFGPKTRWDDKQHQGLEMARPKFLKIKIFKWKISRNETLHPFFKEKIQEKNV